ncbi:MAG: hypothetical protein ACRELF_05435 [Gemmataceae bacterium]
MTTNSEERSTCASLYAWAADRLAELGGDVPDDHDPDRANQVRQVRAVLSHCLRSETAKGIRAALSLAQSEPSIPILHEQRNRDPCPHCGAYTRPLEPLFAVGPEAEDRDDE